MSLNYSEKRKGLSNTLLTVFLVVITINIIMGTMVFFWQGPQRETEKVVIKNEVYVMKDSLDMAGMYLRGSARNSLYQAMYENGLKGGWSSPGSGMVMSYNGKGYGVWYSGRTDQAPSVDTIDAALEKSFLTNFAKYNKGGVIQSFLPLNFPVYSIDDFAGRLRLSVTDYFQTEFSIAFDDGPVTAWEAAGITVDTELWKYTGTELDSAEKIRMYEHFLNAFSRLEKFKSINKYVTKMRVLKNLEYTSCDQAGTVCKLHTSFEYGGEGGSKGWIFFDYEDMTGQFQKDFYGSEEGVIIHELAHAVTKIETTSEEYDEFKNLNDPGILSNAYLGESAEDACNDDYGRTSTLPKGFYDCHSYESVWEDIGAIAGFLLDGNPKVTEKVQKRMNEDAIFRSKVEKVKQILERAGFQVPLSPADPSTVAGRVSTLAGAMVMSTASQVQIKAVGKQNLVIEKAVDEDFVRLEKSSEINMRFYSPLHDLYFKALVHHTEIKQNLGTCSIADEHSDKGNYVLDVSVLQVPGTGSGGACVVMVNLTTKAEFLYWDGEKTVLDPISLVFIESSSRVGSVGGLSTSTASYVSDQNNPGGKVNLLLVADGSYRDAGAGWTDAFKQDAQNYLETLFAMEPFKSNPGYRSRFNVSYITDKTASCRQNTDGSSFCSRDFAYSTDMYKNGQVDAVVILKKTSWYSHAYKDTMVASDASSFVHEISHVVFGLADEYQKSTDNPGAIYFETGQDAGHNNLWAAKDACEAYIAAYRSEIDASITGCEELQDGESRWYRIPADNVMVSLSSGTFGPAGVKRISYVLEQDNPRGSIRQAQGDMSGVAGAPVGSSITITVGVDAALPPYTSVTGTTEKNLVYYWNDRPLARYRIVYPSILGSGGSTPKARVHVRTGYGFLTNYDSEVTDDVAEKVISDYGKYSVTPYIGGTGRITAKVYTDTITGGGYQYMTIKDQDSGAPVARFQISGGLVKIKVKGNWGEFFSTLPDEEAMTAATLSAKSMALPAASRKIASCYGWRFHPVYKEWRFHGGLDISPDPVYGSDKTIRAFAEGVVVNAPGCGSGWGNCVIIRHDGRKFDDKTLYSLYAHLSSISVRQGQNVNTGDKIGVMGDTGVSTGIHLHFQLGDENVNVEAGPNTLNPCLFLNCYQSTDEKCTAEPATYAPMS